jgi:hypothetical protein
MTNWPSLQYIMTCDNGELIELGFDAQRAITCSIESNGTEEEWADAMQFRKVIKAELLRRMGAK